MRGKGRCQWKWCAPAAMEPIVSASRTSDSIDYWHYTHSKSTCWKRSMTTTSFHSSKLLRMHTAMSAGNTWRNTIRITGKFICKTMTKLKLFNYHSHPVLHAGIARTLRKRLCFLSSLGCVMFRFSHTAICSMLYFWCALATDTRAVFCLFFFHHKHRTPKGWRVRKEGHCWLVRTLLWCSPAWYWITVAFLHV